MVKHFLFALGFTLFFTLGIKSQDSLVRCSTSADLDWLQANSPDRYQRFADLETFTNNFINNQSQTSGRLINGNGLIVIPVVVHILHNGEPEGTGFNISMSTIQSQINVLNEDYRRTNADAVNTPSIFQPVAGDFGIEFRLACIDPNGNPSNGVDRKQTSISQFIPVGLPNERYDEVTMGIKTLPNGSLPWPTDKYLNIWVCNLKGLAGYATFPADYSTHPQFDGVVVDKGAFGRNGGTVSGFDKGRTATHEIGHWLNLKHLWSDKGGPQFNYDCLSDDLIGDTPQQKTFNSGCPSFPEILRKCNGTDPSSMFMNYMDYVNDQCYNLFTNGQRLRARALFATGGPRAVFLNNYFQIQPPAKVSCNGSVIKLFNPTCATPTWSIVSGNATIVNGQGTNSLTISTPAPGSFVLRATGGNYTEDKTITTAPYTSSDYVLTGNNISSSPVYWCLNQSVLFYLSGLNGATVSNTNWVVPSGWTIVPPSPGNSMIRLKAPATSSQPTATLSVSFTEPCGSVINKSLYLAYAPTTCVVVDPRFTYSPNPASINLNVAVATAYLGTVFIRKIQLVNYNSGITYFNQDYSSQNISNTNVNMVGYPTGTYVLRIYDGTNWSTYTIMH